MSRLYTLLCFLVLFLGNVVGQSKFTENRIVKINILTPLIRSYNFSYETGLNSNWSVLLNANWRPKNKFPFQSKIESYYTDNDLGISDTKVSQYSITPELRYYLMNGSSFRGFYVSAFLQYAKYGAETIVGVKGSSKPSLFQMDGSLNTYSIGGAIGYQWRFRNSVYLDWMMVGPFFGVNSGQFRGVNFNNKPLNNAQQAVLENKPNEFRIPLVDVKVEADDSSINVKTNKYWAGSRMGLSLGYRL